MLPSLIPQEDADAAKELAKQFGKRNIALHLEKQCTKVEDSGSALTVHFGEGETVEADLMLVSVGRAPQVENLGLEELGVELDRRGIAADEHRRTTVDHIYAVGDCAGYWQLAHTAFREGEVAAENAMGHEAVVDNRAVPRPIYTDPEIAGVGLTEQEAREQYGDDVEVGMFPWVANARAVMQNETTGWVKSIHESRYGELGLVMVGPHVTDLIEAGVVAIDAEATVETVADGMAAHPTLSEAIKEAGLVALGRAIHLPNRKRAAKATACGRRPRTCRLRRRVRWPASVGPRRPREREHGEAGRRSAAPLRPGRCRYRRPRPRSGERLADRHEDQRDHPVEGVHPREALRRDLALLERLPDRSCRRSRMRRPYSWSRSPMSGAAAPAQGAAATRVTRQRMPAARACSASSGERARRRGGRRSPRRSGSRPRRPRPSSSAATIGPSTARIPMPAFTTAAPRKPTLSHTWDQASLAPSSKSATKRWRGEGSAASIAAGPGRPRWHEAHRVEGVDPAG